MRETSFVLYLNKETAPKSFKGLMVEFKGRKVPSDASKLSISW
jgi:hypothetical protein